MLVLLLLHVECEIKVLSIKKTPTPNSSYQRFLSHLQPLRHCPLCWVNTSSSFSHYLLLAINHLPFESLVIISTFSQAQRIPSPPPSVVNSMYDLLQGGNQTLVLQYWVRCLNGDRQESNEREWSSLMGRAFCGRVTQTSGRLLNNGDSNARTYCSFSVPMHVYTSKWWLHFAQY